MAHEYCDRIGKYKIVGTLKTGVLGESYLVTSNEQASEKFVLKVFQSQVDERVSNGCGLGGFPSLIEPSSEGTVGWIDDGAWQEDRYLVRKYVEGQSLERMLFAKNVHQLSPAQLINCFSQIANVLDAWHQNGGVHKNLKLSNVIVDGSNRCYLIDLGGSVDPQSIYFSPEQVLAKTLTKESDLYALAVMFYVGIARRFPFLANDFNELLDQILHSAPLSLTSFISAPLSLEAVFDKALSKQAEDRYASAQEMLKALIESVDGDFSFLNCQTKGNVSIPDEACQDREQKSKFYLSSSFKLLFPLFTVVVFLLVSLLYGLIYGVDKEIKQDNLPVVVVPSTEKTIIQPDKKSVNSVVGLSDKEVLLKLHKLEAQPNSELMVLAREFLQHPNYVIRFETLKSLAKIDDKAVENMFYLALVDYDPLIRGMAAKVLGVKADAHGLLILIAAAKKEQVYEVWLVMNKAIKRISERLVR